MLPVGENGWVASHLFLPCSIRSGSMLNPKNQIHNNLTSFLKIKCSTWTCLSLFTFACLCLCLCFFTFWSSHTVCLMWSFHFLGFGFGFCNWNGVLKFWCRKVMCQNDGNQIMPCHQCHMTVWWLSSITIRKHVFVMQLSRGSQSAFAFDAPEDCDSNIISFCHWLSWNFSVKQFKPQTFFCLHEWPSVSWSDFTSPHFEWFVLFSLNSQAEWHPNFA